MVCTCVHQCLPVGLQGSPDRPCNHTSSFYSCRCCQREHPQHKHESTGSPEVGENADTNIPWPDWPALFAVASGVRLLVRATACPQTFPLGKHAMTSNDQWRIMMMTRVPGVKANANRDTWKAKLCKRFVEFGQGLNAIAWPWCIQRKWEGYNRLHIVASWQVSIELNTSKKYEFNT